MIDQVPDPVDVIAGTRVPTRLAGELAESIHGCSNFYPSDHDAGQILDEALENSDFQVVPAVDDATRKEVEALVERAHDLASTGHYSSVDALRMAELLADVYFKEAT